MRRVGVTPIRISRTAPVIVCSIRKLSRPMFCAADFTASSVQVKRNTPFSRLCTDPAPLARQEMENRLIVNVIQLTTRAAALFNQCATGRFRLYLA